MTFSVFVSYYILEPYFKTYSVKLLILAAISLFISHHISAFILICIIEREYASVSELILIVKAVTTSIVITMVVVTIVTGNRPFLDCI